MDVLYAGDVVDPDPPVCALSDDLAAVRSKLEGGRYGFCLVLAERGTVLGRIRRSALSAAGPGAAVGDVMEPGPGTVRPSTRASDLVERLAKRELTSAVVTNPEGGLIGVFHRADAERRLRELES